MSVADLTFISDRAALEYLKEWAINDEHYPLMHVTHLKIEAAYKQVDEQLWRLEELEH